MNNEANLSLSDVLSISCTRNNIHCTSKKRALEIISELAATALALPENTLFEALLTREKSGQPVSVAGLPSPRKTGQKRGANRLRRILHGATYRV